jgi:hypothetical protein
VLLQLFECCLQETPNQCKFLLAGIFVWQFWFKTLIPTWLKTLIQQSSTITCSQLDVQCLVVEVAERADYRGVLPVALDRIQPVVGRVLPFVLHELLDKLEVVGAKSFAA